MRPLIVLVLVALLPAAIRAQVIRGVVLEEGGAQQIAGATLELLHAADSAMVATVQSDARGWFQFTLALPGDYLLRASHLSFRARGLSPVSVASHEIVTVVVPMGRAAIALEPIVVTARTFDKLAGFYRRSQEPGQGKFIQRAYIDSRIGLQPTELLRMTPGVRLTRTDGPFRTFTVTLPSPAGACVPRVYLDGLPVFTDSIFSIDDITSSEALEGVEIYDGYATIPPSLHVTDDRCVIAFWTRREQRGAPFSWKKLGLFFLGAGALVWLTVGRS